MNAPDLLPVGVGDMIADKYRVDRVIGAGGMGVVVQATHLQLEQRVAIKFLLPDAAENPEVVQRFAREARAAARVQNEHIVRVMDVASLPSGAPYMVMEYLEGGDLAEVIQERGPLPVDEAVGYLLQACEAVGEAHAAGIVHRDLKPANLFLARKADRPAVVKVLDFGISKAMDPGSGPGASLTRTSAVMGSALYMSPEQMKSTRSVDTRADIWALGVILYEALSGRVPFESETMPELCARVLTEPPRPIRELRSDLPDALVEAIERCLHKDRDKRFQSVQEVAEAIAPFAPARPMMHSGSFHQGSTTAVPLVTRASAGAARSQGSTGVAWGQTAGEEPPKRRSGLWIGIVAVLVVAAAVPTVLLLRPRGDTMPSQALVPGSSAPAAEPSAPVASAAPSSTTPVASATVSQSAEPPSKAPPARTTGGKAPSKSTAEPPPTPTETTPPPPATTPPPKPVPTPTSPLNINLK